MTRKVILVLFFLFVLLMWFIGSFNSQVEEQAVELTCNEYTEQDSLLAQITQYRSWIEYTYQDGYCTQYSLSDSGNDESFNFRDTMWVADDVPDNEFWRSVYQSLYDHDKDQLMELQDSLLAIKTKQQLDKDDFARLVVSFVQDIPYNYIVPEACEGDLTAGPCVPYVRFGLLSPVEFLYRLQGDCDTRTVLLYTLLRNLGYQPLILNSQEYLHSMLALDIASSGEGFIYKGRTYSYWETTNIGWLPGMLPPDMNNKNYWHVILDSDVTL